jgi:hypothetical protein
MLLKIHVFTASMVFRQIAPCTLLAQTSVSRENDACSRHYYIYQSPHIHCHLMKHSQAPPAPTLLPAPWPRPEVAGVATPALASAVGGGAVALQQAPAPQELAPVVLHTDAEEHGMRRLLPQP